jgi:hypothetical protein
VIKGGLETQRIGTSNDSLMREHLKKERNRDIVNAANDSSLHISAIALSLLHDYRTELLGFSSVKGSALPYGPRATTAVVEALMVSAWL